MKKFKPEQRQIKLDTQRREFIKKSTLTGLGVAASTLIPATAMANESDKKIQHKQQKGYQLTPHVIEYYKSAAS